jgi:hypothetical protein
VSPTRLIVAPTPVKRGTRNREKRATPTTSRAGRATRGDPGPSQARGGWAPGWRASTGQDQLRLELKHLWGQHESLCFLLECTAVSPLASQSKVSGMATQPSHMWP